MDSLIFSLNATMPVFLLMLLGIVFRRLGWLERGTARNSTASCSGRCCR